MYLWAFWIFWHFGSVLFNVESDLFQQSAGCLISWRPQPVVHTHKPLSSGLDSHTALQASMVVSSLEEALVHVSTHDSQSVPVTLLCCCRQHHYYHLHTQREEDWEIIDALTDNSAFRCTITIELLVYVMNGSFSYFKKMPWCDCCWGKQVERKSIKTLKLM